MNRIPVMVALVAALAAASPAPGEPTASEGARVERIPGGPTVLLIPQRAVPMFSCTVLIPAGSALETEKTNGAAHYLEHLLFNGTTTRTREEIYARADFLGAYHNASTQRERTIFQLLLPSENWREGLELQADMLLRSTLPKEMFEKEKGIILEELAKDRTDATYDANAVESRALYGNASWSLPVLGTEKSIKKMNRKALEEFYRDRYRPSGMTLVVMGDVDPGEALAEITALYSGGEEEPVAPPSAPPIPPGRILRTAPVEGLGKLRLGIHLPLPASDGSDFAAIRLLEEILVSGERAAVSRAVEASGVTSLGTSVAIHTGSRGSRLSIGVEITEGSGDPESDARRVVDHVLAHLERFAEIGPGADQLGAARRSILAEEISLREKMHYYGLMRADVLTTAGPEATLGLVDSLDRMDGRHVTAKLWSALQDGRILVVVMGEGLPDARHVLYGESVTAAWLLDNPEEPPSLPPDAPPARIVDESERLVLENGPTLIHRGHADSRTFAAHVLIRDRSRVEDDLGLPRGAVDVLHRMLAMGTRNRSESELRGELARLGAKVKTTDSEWIPYDDYYFSPEYSYLRLETIDVSGLETLALLGEMLTQPRFTKEALEKAVGAAAARAEKDASKPSSVARHAYYETLQPGHPLTSGVLGDPEELRRLTLGDLGRLHAKLVTTDRVVLAVSSSFPTTEIRSVVERSFRLPRGESRPEVAALDPIAIPAEGVTREIETGQTQSYVIVGAPVRVEESDRPALSVATALLSERLADRLREGEGLAYSIGASYRPTDPANVRMSAGTRPENLERMVAGMKEVATSLVAEPPTSDQITGALNRSEGRTRMRRLSRIGQTYAMVMSELRGGDPLDLDVDLPALRNVTPDDVARIAAAHLTFAPSVTVTAR